MLDNSTNGCVSAAALLGDSDSFAAYNLAFIWVAALLLFGFLGSWLFNLREHNWHLSGRPGPSMLIHLLIEASNLHSLDSRLGIARVQFARPVRALRRC